MWLDILYGVSAGAALCSLPGSWALARWSWAARQPVMPVSAAPCCEPILLLVPAHNEAATLTKTLPALVRQAADDRDCQLVVIADNCTDATALTAREAGAEVLVRNDLTARGKGFALAYAFAQFPDRPWYLIVDADSELDPDFLLVLRRKLSEHPAGVQTRYAPLCAVDDPRAALKHWALRAFNVIRPRGRAALGEGVGLLGNGFVLSGATLQAVPYQAGSVVEDLEYQLALAKAGLKLEWLEDVAVHGEMPQGEGAKIQRQRWEGGRLAMLRLHAPGLALQVLRGNWQHWPALQELLLLPLSLHLLLLLLACAVGGLPGLIGLVGIVILSLHALQALAELPRAMRASALLALPAYLFWKLAQLPAVVRGSGKKSPWLRSSRKAEQGKST